VGTARISGIVKNAADDAPLARARVMATSPALPEPRVAITGADGRYVLAELPPGAYTITATRTGFAPYSYGQGRSMAGTPVAVANGQQFANVDFPLVAGGVIAGRILDEDGAAFAGAAVDALVHRFQGGSDALFSVATVQTDDRGEFRLYGLAPGAYYVSAADPAFTSVSAARRAALFRDVLPGHDARRPGAPRRSAARAPPRVEFSCSSCRRRASRDGSSPTTRGSS
jgi:hypothetical protein